VVLIGDASRGEPAAHDWSFPAQAGVGAGRA